MTHTKKGQKMAIRHKNKVGYLSFFHFNSICSSLKILLLYYVASFVTEAKGGWMVKEQDFEAEIFKKSICLYV